MVKVRSLREALAYIKSQDNDTGISENAIRVLVVSGKIPSVKVGRKYLVNVDTLLRYFEVRLAAADETVPQKDDSSKGIGEDIRAIPERLKRHRTSV